MKKKIIWSLLLLIIPFITVKAATKTYTITSTAEPYGTKITWVNEYGPAYGGAANAYMIKDDSTGIEYPFYCQEPSVKGPDVDTVYTEKTLKQGNAAKYLAGLKTILESSASDEAKRIAVKIFSVGLGISNTGGAYSTAYAGYANLSKKLMGDASDAPESKTISNLKIDPAIEVTVKQLLTTASAATPATTTKPTIKVQKNTDIVTIKTFGTTGEWWVKYGDDVECNGTHASMTNGAGECEFKKTGDDITISLTASKKAEFKVSGPTNCKVEGEYEYDSDDESEVTILETAEKKQLGAILKPDGVIPPASPGGTTKATVTLSSTDLPKSYCTTDTYEDCDEYFDVDFYEICEETGVTTTTSIYIKDYKTEAKDELEKCLLKQAENLGIVEDFNGNSLIATGIIDSNPYCKAVCHESYTAKLPGPSNDNTSGSYFTLDDGTGIEFYGTDKLVTNCYTTKINTAKLETDIESNNIKMAAEKTKYNNYKAQSNVSVPTAQKECDEWGSETDEDGTPYPVCEKYIYYCNYNWQYYKVDKDNNQTLSGYNTTADVSEDNNCSNETTDFRNAAKEEMKKNEEKMKKLALIPPQIIEQYNNCTDNMNDTNIEEVACQTERKFEFDYYEEYSNLTGKIELDDLLANINTEYSYCDKVKGKENDMQAAELECDGTKAKSKNTSVPYLVCTVSGCIKPNDKKRYDINYVIAKATSEKEYDLNPVFYNIFPSGDITIDSSSDPLSMEEIDGFPISLDTPKGKYWYRYTLTDQIGHYFDSASCDPGRLDEYITGDAEYICYYEVNNCPNCPFECFPGDPCDFDPPCNGVDCINDCEGLGCILDVNGGLAVTFGTYNLNNLFPNSTLSLVNNSTILAFANIKRNNSSLAVVSSSRTVGANWMSDKGTATKNEIEDYDSGKAEEIYNGSPEYEITLTPSLISKIKADNITAGSYLNDSLECKKNVTLDYITCTSPYLTTIGVTTNSPAVDFVKWNGATTSVGGFGVGPAWK